MKKSNFRNVSKGNRKSVCFIRKILLVALILLTIPMSGMASQERYVLDFNDSHIKGYRGEAATIFLKKSLKAQYPWVKIQDLELKKVVLVAKSKRGHGAAELRVGKWVTDMYGVGGDPRRFHDRARDSFDRVRFWNPSNSSNGPWQISLKGNFIVRKVVLVVRDHHRRKFYGGYERRHRW